MENFTSLCYKLYNDEELNPSDFKTIVDCLISTGKFLVENSTINVYKSEDLVKHKKKSKTKKK